MNKIKISIGAFIVVILFTACENGASKSDNKEVIMTTDSKSITSVEDKNESKSEFPQNIAMLLPTQYRKESTGYPKGVKEKEWYEFYKDEKSGKWMVAKADLKITYDRDECVGEDVMIINSNHENAVFFFTPFEGLSKNIETAVEDKPLYPGYEVNFSMNGINYRFNGAGKVFDRDTEKILSPEEIKKKNTEDLEYSILRDYIVWFNIPKSAYFNIAQVNEIQGATPTLIWAGDMNGDGLPDAVFSLPDFYESQQILFFLSDKNDKETPLKKVADLMVVNDC
ncbi:MAG TPA: hypothetical protein PKX92_04710 [Edaphocola sp.]|nr:hypothetical protein [Edaphocola sp.]